MNELQWRYRAPFRLGVWQSCLFPFKTGLTDARIWIGSRDSCLEAFWYDCDLGDMRKARYCYVTDTGMPECNLILTCCNVGFCNGKIDTKAKERACCAEGGLELGFDVKSSVVLNNAIGID